jgi:hypothetical protein
MLRLALLLAIPAWSAATLPIVRGGGRRAAWTATLLAALLLAAWAGSRVGTANPISRFGRWDPWLVAVMGVLLLAIPGVGVTWGVSSALAVGRPAWMAVGIGAVAGLAALPLALAVALLVDVLWPH